MLKTDTKTSCTNRGNAPILFLMSGYCKPNFACQNIQESVDCDKKIVLSLTDFEKSNCFAALMFDKRILPSEIAEPTYGAQSCGCVFIKALQSKDFLEILLICVNFFVAAHGFICF